MAGKYIEQGPLRVPSVARVRGLLTINEEGRRSEIDRAQKFFAEVANGERFPDTSAFVITHLLPATGDTFLHGLSQISPIAGVFPKRRSIGVSEPISLFSKGIPIIPWQKEEISDPQLVGESFTELLGSDTQNLVILDMGGYLASSAASLSKVLGKRLRGIVEDTENGYQRYLKLQENGAGGIPVPVLSVARSPNKIAEDYLAGQAIVLGTEKILKLIGLPMDGMGTSSALVIGYGKLGSSIADGLTQKMDRIMVNDSSAIKLTEASAHRFEILPLDIALQNAEIIFSATGNAGLNRSNYHKIRAGAYVTTVTSADDELDLEGLHDRYRLRTHPLSAHIDICEARDSDHFFYLINKGNAVNLSNNIELGPHIYLTQAELLRGFQLLAGRDNFTNDIQEVPHEERQRIASLWLKYFKGIFPNF